MFMKASSSSNLNQKKTAKGARETFDLKELQAAMLVPMQAFAALLASVWALLLPIWIGRTLDD